MAASGELPASAVEWSSIEPIHDERKISARAQAWSRGLHASTSSKTAGSCPGSELVEKKDELDLVQDPLDAVRVDGEAPCRTASARKPRFNGSKVPTDVVLGYW